MAITSMLTRLIGIFALAAVCAAAFGLLGDWQGTVGQSERPLRIAVDRSEVLAEGGSAQVTVRLDAGAGDASTTVTLSTDFGAFGADSGPSQVVVRLARVEGGDEWEGGVTLVGDGRPGLAVVTARVGVLVDAATVRFIGAPAEIMILRPAADRPLDASRSHVVQLEVRDRLGQLVPGAPLRLEASRGTLRSAAGESGGLIALRTSERGRVSATLSAAAGDLLLRAVSVEARAELELIFHGEPVSLRLWALNPVLERGSETETAKAVVLARLVDEGGRAVPGRRVSLAVEDGSEIRLIVDGDPSALVTDGGGGVLAQATASAAQSGDYWLKAETEAGGGLGDVVELTVVGAPETIYLTATPIDVMEESNGDVREYILRAEVVDPAGRQVAPGYTLRWRVALRGGESTLSAESSPVQRGVATSRLRIEDPVGEPRLQVWLIEAPKVESEGALEDLAASGLALRPGINAVTWVGATKSVDAAVAPIGHLEVTVWRKDPERAGWQVYTTQENAPERELFDVERGDRLHIRVESAARLPGAAR